MKDGQNVVVRPSFLNLSTLSLLILMNNIPGNLNKRRNWAAFHLLNPKKKKAAPVLKPLLEAAVSL